MWAPCRHRRLGYDTVELNDRAGGRDDVNQRKMVLAGLVAWYAVVSVWTACAPADRQFWLLASILPAALVVFLAATHRALPLSPASYASITLFLTLHMVGVHYTYAQVPAGFW